MIRNNAETAPPKTEKRSVLIESIKFEPLSSGAKHVLRLIEASSQLNNGMKRIADTNPEIYQPKLWKEVWVDNLTYVTAVRLSKKLFENPSNNEAKEKYLDLIHFTGQLNEISTVKAKVGKTVNGITIAGDLQVPMVRILPRKEDSGKPPIFYIGGLNTSIGVIQGVLKEYHDRGYSVISISFPASKTGFYQPGGVVDKIMQENPIDLMVALNEAVFLSSLKNFPGEEFEIHGYSTGGVIMQRLLKEGSEVATHVSKIKLISIAGFYNFVKGSVIKSLDVIGNQAEAIVSELGGVLTLLLTKKRYVNHLVDVPLFLNESAIELYIKKYLPKEFNPKELSPKEFREALAKAHKAAEYRTKLEISVRVSWASLSKKIKEIVLIGQKDDKIVRTTDEESRKLFLDSLVSPERKVNVYTVEGTHIGWHMHPWKAFDAWEGVTKVRNSSILYDLTSRISSVRAMVNK